MIVTIKLSVIHLVGVCLLSLKFSMVLESLFFQHLGIDSEGLKQNVTTGAKLQSSKLVDNLPLL